MSKFEVGDLVRYKGIPLPVGLVTIVYDSKVKTTYNVTWIMQGKYPKKYDTCEEDYCMEKVTI